MWVKIDDNFPDNPKVEDLSDGAFRLYVAGLCHGQKHLTDGVIKYDRPPRLIPRYRKEYVAELITAGLWEQNGRGYLIHDFTIWNKTREYWLAKRAADAKRRAEWLARQKEEPPE